jgi:hypothetical protein
MTDKTTTGNSGNKDLNASGSYLACGVLMAMILLLDLSIPLGVAIAVAYIVVVLISLWSSQNKFTVLVAVVCSVFTIGAFFYKPVVAEMWKVIFNRTISLLAIWVTASLGLQRKIAEQRREQALREREKALEDIRILRGLLPICASCKKIRDDQGYWIQMEAYIRDHSEAEFSHGMCQECAKKLYPEFYKEIKLDANTDT